MLDQEYSRPLNPSAYNCVIVDVAPITDKNRLRRCHGSSPNCRSGDTSATHLRRIGQFLASWSRPLQMRHLRASGQVCALCPGLPQTVHLRTFGQLRAVWSPAPQFRHDICSPFQLLYFFQISERCSMSFFLRLFDMG